MKQQHFRIEKQVRVVTIGKWNPEQKTDIWVCLHGYGQLAVWFARNFAHLESEHRIAIVPEGPHRFYLQGTDGRVGASWMTKEDRLIDIEDQFHYLENLLTQHLENGSQKVRIHVFGFSQGVATAMRWLDRTEHNIASLVCWAGTFPPDIDYTLNVAHFIKLNFHACFGDNDPYIPLSKAQELLSQLNEQGISVKSHFYTGEHKIYRDLLDQVITICEG